MNLLIIDDHQLFAEGLKFLLQELYPTIQVFHTKDANKTLEYFKLNPPPDLILLDINLPGISGFSLMQQFQSMNIWSPVLIISATESNSAIKTAIESGASGFISKSSNSGTLIAAIQTVLKGERYIPNSSAYDDKQENTSSKDKLPHITNRQKEILHLLAQGLINKQIAVDLGISSNTVKAHLYEIFRSLGVKNRTAAVKVALKQGLIDQS